MIPTRAVALLCMLMSCVAAAGNEVNGWTESATQNFLRGCVDSSAKKQMQYMYESGQIKKGATDAEVENARSLVMSYVTKTCTCNQERIAQKVAFKDLQNLKDNQSYVQQVTRECAQEALAH